MQSELSDLDRVVLLILDGVLDSRIKQELRGPEWKLTPKKADRLIAKGHAEIAKQQARPLEWHRANAFRLFAASLENANFRVALEAQKELARLDKVHDVASPLRVKLDGTPESVNDALTAIANAALAGDIGNNKLQALLPLIRELRNAAPDGDGDEDLGNIKVGETTVRDAVALVMALQAARG